MQTAVAKTNYNWARQLTNEWRVHSSAQLFTVFPLLLCCRWLTAMEELSAAAGQATETAGQPPADLNVTITRAHRWAGAGICTCLVCWLGGARVRWQERKHRACCRQVPPPQPVL